MKKMNRILQNKRGDLASAALALIVLSTIIFFGFDLSSRSIVYHGSFAAAREGARSYARTLDTSEATTRATEIFESMAGDFGDIVHIQIVEESGIYADYAKATVEAELTNKAFEFVWNLVGSTPNNTIQKSYVYEIESKTKTGTVW